jgi:Zn-finger nucleic acid-binding protein
MARICPDCSTEMAVEEVYGVKLDVCPSCAGIWFDPEELRTLLAQDPVARIELEERTVPRVEQKHAGPSFRRCPDCSLPLQKYHYLYDSPIVLDACTNCGGFWVQDGELGKMQQWVDRSHKPMTAEEKARLTLAEATIAHNEEMHRQRNLLHLFDMLRQYQPGWMGMLP